MNRMVQKVVLVMVTMILLFGGLPISPKTAYAQPPNPNWNKAMALQWLSDLEFDAMLALLMRTWPTFYAPDGPLFRPHELQDTDGKKKEDTRQRLLRWDRRPPNNILVNGLIPQVTDENPKIDSTQLRTYVLKNTKSIFVSTTKTLYKNGVRVYPYTPTNWNRGIEYQYEIFAPGGIDINETFKKDSQIFKNENEVAFPGGIRPEFIRSVREYHNGEIVRIWINPYFVDPGDLEPIAGTSQTEFVNWRPDHPEGNNKNPDARADFNPDSEMYAPNGYVPVGNDLHPYYGPNVIPDGEYQIKSRKDENVVVDLSANKSGAVVHAYQNYGLDNQKWKFTYSSSKQAYKITSVQNQTFALTWDSKQGNSIIGYEDYGYNDQYWKIEVTEDGYYKLRSLYDSHKLLDLHSGNTVNGTPILAWEANGTPSQEWVIAPTSYRPLEDGLYQIEPKISDKVIDLAEGSKSSIQLYTNYQKANQTWKLTYYESKKAYTIRSEADPNLLLGMDTRNNKIEAGSYYISPYDTQYWRIEQTKDGDYKLRNFFDLSLVMDLAGGNTGNGATIQGYTDKNNNNQKWKIKPMVYQTIEDGVYQISSKLDINKVAELIDRDVKIADNRYTATQKWKFTYNPEKKAYSVVNEDKNDQYMGNFYGNIMGLYGGFDNSHWRPVITSDGSFILKNLENPKKVIDVPGGNVSNGQQLQAWDQQSNNNNQKWYLNRVDAPVISDGDYYIGSKLDYKQVISTTDNSGQPYIVIWPHNIYPDQVWKFKYDRNKQAYKIYNGVAQNVGLYYSGEGVPPAVTNIDRFGDDDLAKYWIVEYNGKDDGYLIRSKGRPELVLDLSGGSLNKGTRIDAWRFNKGKNQLWNLIPTTKN